MENIGYRKMAHHYRLVPTVQATLFPLNRPVSKHGVGLPQLATLNVLESGFELFGNYFQKIISMKDFRRICQIIWQQLL